MPSIGIHQAQIATYRYNVTTDGGAIGPHNLRGEGNGGTNTLPDNALLLRAWIEPTTDAASAGLATIAVGIEGNIDALIAATAFSDVRFDPDTVTAATAKTPVKVNAAAGVAIIATVAVAALTAGAFDLHVEYLPGR